MIPEHLMHTDPLVERFEQWARQPAKRGVLARGSSQSDRDQCENTRTPPENCAGQDAPFLFSGFARSACDTVAAYKLVTVLI